MPTDAELTFADHTGRYYARRFAFPPMVGRLIGYLAVCDPPEQSIADLADALLASRSAITGAVKMLETIKVVRRERVAGERMDRVRIDMSTEGSMGLDPSEYSEMAELATEGLELLGDAPVERKAALLEMRSFAEFLLEQLPVLADGWTERREKLVAEGTLPAEAPGARKKGVAR